MSFTAYPEYTDSGFQWLGAVPSSWSSVPFGMLFRRIKRTDHGDEELLSVYRDYGVIRKSDRDDNFNNASDDLSSYQLVEPGDLAMNKMKAWQGSLGVSDLRGIVSPAYFVFSPRKQYHPPFTHYLLRSPPYAAGYMTISKGIRINQWDVDPDHLTTLPVLFPSIVEQEAIATFLDRETAKIDALVAEQEGLIALLKEKRQAVISHAVTKGLDPDAPMKDSGIEWLGEIPAHWEVIPLKKALTFQEGPGIMAADFQDDGVPLMRVAGVGTRWATLYGCNFLDPDKVKQKWSHFRLVEGDLVISASASMGTISEVGPDAAGAVPYTGLIRFQPTEDLNRDDARAIFGSSLFLTQIDLLKAGAMIQHFGPTHLRQMLLVVPPKAEQLEIVEALKKAVDQIDRVADQADRTVALLKERRAALISAAVTGKIDVRGLVEQYEMEAA